MLSPVSVRSPHPAHGRRCVVSHLGLVGPQSAPCPRAARKQPSDAPEGRAGREGGETERRRRRVAFIISLSERRSAALSLSPLGGLLFEISPPALAITIPPGVRALPTGIAHQKRNLAKLKMKLNCGDTNV